MEHSEKQYTADMLFSDDASVAFAHGCGVHLLSGRNANAGRLMTSERGLYYVQILYRMLMLRREHELDPLYDRVYEGVVEAQESVSGTEYSSDLFNQDLRQLLEWELIEEHIERERLRGYKDTRKKKFRYLLKEEAIAFVQWLEDRLHATLHPDDLDTRNVLEDLVATLREMRRILNRSRSPHDVTAEDARAVLYRVSRLNRLAYESSQTLSLLNARLLGFVTARYNADDARAVIQELGHYLERFLGRVAVLRKEILPEFEKLRATRLHKKWGRCLELMEQERRESAHLLRRENVTHPLRELEQLQAFHEAGGKLDMLCQRVHTSALGVWRKLYTHLRELERRNHRIEDIRLRLEEMTEADPDVSSVFIHQLLAPAQMMGDPHYWDTEQNEKATPPQPRREMDRHRSAPVAFLKSKQKGTADKGPVRSLEERKMEDLRDWFETQLLRRRETCRVSDGAFQSFDDFTKIIELARAGLLGEGRKLARAGWTLDSLDDPVEVRVDRQVLTFYEMMLKKSGDGNG
ncbi:MAG: DUF2397 family protein [Spartobacteria bacterium]|nr:DUF2397 family protein [Spartobacteria bacterium]